MLKLVDDDHLEASTVVESYTLPGLAQEKGVNVEQQKTALGKGLNALFRDSKKTSEVPTTSSKAFFECDIADIVPNPDQPRKLFSKESIDELASSIAEKGIIQPLLVRPLGGGKFELIAGERRYRASRQLGLEKVPVVIKETTGSETLELALIENIQREDLNPIEEALAYKELLSKYQYTQEELAKQIGKDRSSIANSLRLLKLPDKVREMLISNRISMGHARALLSVESKELQIQIADDVIKNNLSVREVETLTKKLKDQQLQVSAAEEEVSAEPGKDYSTVVQQIEDRIRKKVAIKNKKGKGQVVISFSNDQELNDIVDLLLKW